MKYDEHLTLQNIDSPDESTAVGEDAISKDDAAISEDDPNEITSSSASSRTLIVDTQRSLDVRDHCFLDDTELLNELSNCLKGCDSNFIVSPSTREKVVALNKHLSRRLQQRISLLPKHVQHNFVWSACRDNVHAIAQLFTLLR